MWKFADDNTISEVILKDEESTLQETMNQVADWSKENKFQLNPKKCKELRINFTKQSHSCEPVRINDQCLEIVKSAKILGMLITDDLKWNCHIENIVSKASKRLYLLRQLNRADVEESSLLQFYTACIRIHLRIWLSSLSLKPARLLINGFRTCSKTSLKDYIS